MKEKGLDLLLGLLHTKDEIVLKFAKVCLDRTETFIKNKNAPLSLRAKVLSLISILISLDIPEALNKGERIMPVIQSYIESRDKELSQEFKIEIATFLSGMVCKGNKQAKKDIIKLLSSIERFEFSQGYLEIDRPEEAILSKLFSEVLFRGNLYALEVIKRIFSHPRLSSAKRYMLGFLERIFSNYILYTYPFLDAETKKAEKENLKSFIEPLIKETVSLKGEYDLREKSLGFLKWANDEKLLRSIFPTLRRILKDRQEPLSLKKEVLEVIRGSPGLLLNEPSLFGTILREGDFALKTSAIELLNKYLKQGKRLNKSIRSLFPIFKGLIKDVIRGSDKYSKERKGGIAYGLYDEDLFLMEMARAVVLLTNQEDKDYLLRRLLPLVIEASISQGIEDKVMITLASSDGDPEVCDAILFYLEDYIKDSRKGNVNRKSFLLEEITMFSSRRLPLKLTVRLLQPSSFNKLSSEVKTAILRGGIGFIAKDNKEVILVSTLGLVNLKRKLSITLWFLKTSKRLL
jgi:hypothetical protein